MWLIWKWRKTKDCFSEIKIEMNQKVKNHKFFWNLKSPWATPHSGRSNRSSNRSGVSLSAERTRNQLSPSCGSIAPKRRKGSFWNSPRTRIIQIISHVHSKKGWFFGEFVKRKTWGLKRTLCWTEWDGRHEGFKYSFVLEFKRVWIYSETSIGYKYQKSRHEFYLHQFSRIRSRVWTPDRPGFAKKGFYFRHLKIKRIDAAFSISIRLFSNYLKWNSPWDGFHNDFQKLFLWLALAF